MHRKSLIALTIGLVCIPATVFAAGKVRYAAGVAAVVEAETAEEEEDSDDGAIIINDVTDAGSKETEASEDSACRRH